MFETETEILRTTLLAKASSSVEENLNNENGDRISVDDMQNGEDNNDCHSNCCRFRLWLIEPVILMLVFAYRLSLTVLKNQVLYQTCTAILNYNRSDCELLSSANASDHIIHIEINVQKYAARVLLVLDIVQSVVPALCGPFVGIWADRFGRKPLLVTAYTGYLLTYLLAALITNCALHTPLSPWYFLVAILPTVFSGGAVTYGVAAVCYIADISSESERPFRMMLYDAAMYGGLLFGSLTAGYIFDFGGPVVVFITSTIIVAVAVLLIAFIMPESLGMRQNQIVPRIMEETIVVEELNEGVTNTALIQNNRSLVDLGLLREVWRTGFRKREFNDRAIIWLVIITMLISAFVGDGSGNIFYMFVRARFHWTLKMFTMYESYTLIALIIGNILGLWILRTICGFSMIQMSIIAFLSQASNFGLKAFAFTDWQLYMAIVVGSLKSVAIPMCRTMLTNLVPPMELGQMLSFHSTLQSLMPLIASPLYTIVYSATLNNFPGFYNVLSMNFCLLAVGCLLAIVRKKHVHQLYYERLLN